MSRAVHRAKSGGIFQSGGLFVLFFRLDGARVVCFLPRVPIGFRAWQ